MSPMKSDAEYQALFYENLRKYGHPGIAQDETRISCNIYEFGEEALCKKCGGSGNQLYSMYQACSDCGGSGIAKTVSKTQAFLSSAMTTPTTPQAHAGGVKILDCYIHYEIPGIELAYIVRDGDVVVATGISSSLGWLENDAGGYHTKSRFDELYPAGWSVRFHF